jgi:putative transposase
LEEIIASLSGQVSVSLACRAMGISRATLYRTGEERVVSLVPAPRPTPPRALTQAERDKALSVLHSERFVDTSPGEVVAMLLDEGRYMCSERTMYRILNDHAEVKERRNQARHGLYAKPELLATRPNEVWSWDITKVKGPGRGSYYNLYVVLDIFSRYVVGWRLEHRESDKMAEDLLRTCYRREGVGVGDLTIHSDRGPSMRSKAVSDLLYDLGVAKSHSRPYTSDDNPYSESAFRTLKYRPEMPERFSSIHEARRLFRVLLAWYNRGHRHSGIAMLTPEMVHMGRATEVLAGRQTVLEAAYERHPERFVKGRPMVAALPQSVWINPPQPLPESLLDVGSDTEVLGAVCGDCQAVSRALTGTRFLSIEA